jgi:hypothetical protein
MARARFSVLVPTRLPRKKSKILSYFFPFQSYLVYEGVPGGLIASGQGDLACIASGVKLNDMRPTLPPD